MAEFSLDAGSNGTKGDFAMDEFLAHGDKPARIMRELKSMEVKHEYVVKVGELFDRYVK